MGGIVIRILTVRPANKNEWPDVIRIHRRAVHEIAAADYSAEILQAWAPPIIPEDLPKIEHDFDTKQLNNHILIVAEVNGQLAGFGEVIPTDKELTALYVNPDFSRQKVGSTIMRKLEYLSRLRALPFLRLNASLTAAPFYREHGFHSLGKRLHRLRNGHKIKCIKMCKFFSNIGSASIQKQVTTS